MTEPNRISLPSRTTDKYQLIKNGLIKSTEVLLFTKNVSGFRKKNVIGVNKIAQTSHYYQINFKSIGVQ